MTKSVALGEASGIQSERLGRHADSPWQMPLRGWKDVIVRTWRESSSDNIGIVSAGVAFYAFLALVPLLAAVVLSYGLIAEPRTVIGHVRSLTQVMPADAAKLIGEQLLNVVQQSGGKKGLGIAVSLAIALFGARNAAGSIITALNIAYEEQERRGFLKVNLLALGMTASAVLVSLAGLAAVSVLAFLESLIPTASGLLLVSGKIFAYVLLALVAAAVAATLYRYAPAREQPRWQWISAGSLFTAFSWLLLTLGFGFYVSNFGNYDRTYGSLSAVIVLLTWMYLSSYVFLLGGELNSELEHQTALDTTDGAHKPLGARGAWAADHVAGSKETAGDARHEPPFREAAEQPRLQRPPSTAYQYAAARGANRAGSLVGMRKIGLLGSALATAGLAMMRKRGQAKAGAALLATAAGLALLQRED